MTEVSSGLSATRTSVGAIAGITDTIRKVAEIASAIAGAVEEQTAAVQTSQASNDLLNASGDLAQQAESLTLEMDKLANALGLVPPRHGQIDTGHPRGVGKRLRLRLASVPPVRSSRFMRPHPVFADMPTTIFETMSGLARQHGAINLGQGFPDDQGPQSLRRLAAEALMTGSNQYAPSRGLPELRQAVVEHYGRLQDVALTFDGVLITSGATEAIAASLLAFIHPGDEVIIFEPAYDAYRPLIERAGGLAVAAALTPPTWRLTEAAIEAAVTPRTRMVVFNNPHNPTARAFDADEVSALARVCVRHDLIAVSDEVWEHVIFDGRRHRSLIAEPGMAGRTLKIGSAGKMFGMTGWKIGFVCGDPALVDPVAKAHQFLTFATPPNLQSAVAAGLAWPEASFVEMRQGLQRSRDRLAAGLMAQGFVLTPSEGTYFLGVDLIASGVEETDEAFCLRAVSHFGVAAIPLSAFVTGRAAGSIVRLCFAKADAVLDQAIERLGRCR